MMTSPSKPYLMASEAADHIRSCLPATFPRAEIAIICGSGSGGLVSAFDTHPTIVLPYASIPNFPVGTVQGHQSQLVFATMGKIKVGVVAMVGRLHFYEGHSVTDITLPIRVFHLLGIKRLIGISQSVFR
jgi:purine-nucleoside phosphorylase